MIKKPEEIALMREAGRRLGRVLGALKREVRAGMKTSEIDARAGELIAAEGGTAAFLGYKPSGAKRAYPAISCVSVNDVVVHGVPGPYAIKNGDIVKVDLGLVYKGWYADAAFTVAVGKISDEARRLIAATEEALRRAIAVARPGKSLGDIGYAVSSCVAEHGFSVVKSLTGHGIGRALHETPWVYNVGSPGMGDPVTVGMVLAIEPMVAVGKGDVKQRADDSFATKDGSLAAHFEHTVAVTEQGPEILTQFAV